MNKNQFTVKSCCEISSRRNLLEIRKLNQMQFSRFVEVNNANREIFDGAESSWHKLVRLQRLRRHFDHQR